MPGTLKAVKLRCFAFQVSSLNASYTDSGLFGFQVAAPSKEIGAVLESTMKAYNDAKAGLTEEDVQRGK